MGTPSSPWSLSRTNRRVATPCCAYPGLKEEEAAYLGTMIPAHNIPGSATTVAAFALVSSRAALLINGTRQIICFILKIGRWPTQGSPVHHPPAAPTPTGMSPSLYEAVACWINGRTGSSVPFLSHGPAANNRFQWRMCFCSVEGLGLIL